MSGLPRVAALSGAIARHELTYSAIILLILGIAAILTAPKAANATKENSWIESLPPTRSGHVLIYDPLRDRMLMFGGHEGGIRRDEVWSLPLSGTPPIWSLVTAQGDGPSARSGHTGIYDSVRDRLLIFGGDDGSYRNDVWSLSLAGTPTWTEVATVGLRPSPRSEHSAIYDPVIDRMIVFGGVGSEPEPNNETWELTLSTTNPTWNELSPTGTLPVARERHTATYDPVRQRMLVFGGRCAPCAGHPVYNDLWALALGGPEALSWSQIVAPGAQPRARIEHIAIYDPVRDRLVIGSGTTFPGYFYPVIEVWALPLAQGAAWQELRIASRWEHAAIYDPVRDGLVIHGGNSDAGHHNTTYRLPLAGGFSDWLAVTPTIGYEHRTMGHTAIYDPVGERMVVYGGQFFPSLDFSASRDTWIHSLDLDGEQGWVYFNPFGYVEVYDHSAIYDPVRHRMLVYGGGSYYKPLNNLVAALDLGNLAWSEVATTGAPPTPRHGHTATYDPVRDRMLVFGGADGNLFDFPGSFNFLNDVWELKLAAGAQWTPLAPLGPPPSGREQHTAIYDPIGDRMIVFGGVSLSGLRNDVWALSLAGTPTWIQLSPSGAPPSPRNEHSAIYDPDRERMVVFGGSGAGDAWTLDLSSPLGVGGWAALEFTGVPPSPRENHIAIYDELDQQMIVFGGMSPAVMALNFGTPLAVSAEVPSIRSFALHPAEPNPSRGKFSLSYALPGSERAALALIDVAGRRVATVDLGVPGPGTHALRFDGQGFPSGVYFIQLTHGQRSVTSKISVLK